MSLTEFITSSMYLVFFFVFFFYDKAMALEPRGVNSEELNYKY